VWIDPSIGTALREKPLFRCIKDYSRLMTAILRNDFSGLMCGLRVPPLQCMRTETLRHIVHSIRFDRLRRCRAAPSHGATAGHDAFRQHGCAVQNRDDIVARAKNTTFGSEINCRLTPLLVTRCGCSAQTRGLCVNTYTLSRPGRNPHIKSE
jgi:hypothetical protein